MNNKDNQNMSLDTKQDFKDKPLIAPGKHHISKSYIAISIWRGLWTTIIIGIVGILNILPDITKIMETGYFGYVIWGSIGVLFLILLIFVAYSIISYKRITWEITDDELHVYKGIFIKKKSHIPYRRIHSIDISAKIIDRIFGVVTFKIDTAAGSASSEDAKIPALTLSTAETLKAEIFRRRNDILTGKNQATVSEGGNIINEISDANESLRGAFGGDSGIDVKLDAEYRFTNKELLLYCFTNGRAFFIIFLVLFSTYQAINFIGNFTDEIYKITNSVVSDLLTMQPFMIVAAVLVAAVITTVISFITRVLTYGNFVVRRYGARIEITRGLLERKSTGIAVKRIQTIRIKQDLLQRILGYAEIVVETASGFGKSSNDQNDVKQGEIIHPFIRKNKIDDYMEKMLKEFDDIPKDFEPLSKKAMTRSMFRYGLFTTLFVLLPLDLTWLFLYKSDMSPMVDVNKFGATVSFNQDGIPMDIALLNSYVVGFSIALFVFMVFIGWAAWRGRGYTRNDKYLAMREGVTGRTRIFVPKKKIQYAIVAQNPFQKRAKVATIKANTAALGSSNEKLKDVEILKCDDYLEWIYTPATK